MIKVLQVYPQFNLGGTEKVITTIFDNIDKTKYEFYFLAEKKGSLDDIIIKKGGKFIYINNDENYSDKLYELFVKEKFDIIHTHTSAAMGDVLKIAKKANIKKRIAHSHNSRTDLNKIFWVIKRYTTLKIENNANIFYACSKIASKWLFPRNVNNTKIIYNSIDIEKYKFNGEYKKNQIFDKLNINKNDKVIINVGRLVKQKNQKFIISVAEKMKSIDKSYKFIIIGEGNLKEELNRLIIEKKLEDNVFLLGAKNNVEEYLTNSDVFIFPSLHEGLGIVAIEAQCNGLSVLTSENIPLNADINENLFYQLNLKDDLDIWCNKLIELYNNKLTEEKRKSIYKLMIKSNYNIKNSIKDVYN